MTKKERLMAVFQGNEVDRPPIKLWNLIPGQSMLHPAYEPVYQAGIRLTDLVVGSGSPFNPYCGSHAATLITKEEFPTPNPDWVDVVTTFLTPNGSLREIYRRGTKGQPGYEMEFLLKEPDDILKLLSMPYEPFPFSRQHFDEKSAAIGDEGIVVFGLDHGMYALQRCIGSENFAVWHLECPAIIAEASLTYAKRVYGHAQTALDHGVRGIFGWVGPELCIPPLMPVDSFDTLVYEPDHALCDLIHDANSWVWVHCHGRMRPVLDRFVNMGVDVLNPIEPPPMGDITLEEAFLEVGSAMGLEGNIETHDIMTASPEAFIRTLRETIEAGVKPGRRFILCASSGYMEMPEPTELHIHNLLLFIQEGLRLAETLS